MFFIKHDQFPHSNCQSIRLYKYLKLVEVQIFKIKNVYNIVLIYHFFYCNLIIVYRLINIKKNIFFFLSKFWITVILKCNIY